MAKEFISKTLSVFIVGLMLMSALGVGISGTMKNDFVQEEADSGILPDADNPGTTLASAGIDDGTLAKLDHTLRQMVQDKSLSKGRAKVIVFTTDVGELAKVIGKYDFKGLVGNKGGNELVTPALDVPVSSLKSIAALDSVLGIIEYPDLSLEKVDPDEAPNFEGTPDDPIDPQGYFDSQHHGAWDAWVEGFIGTDVKVAIPEGGIDFGQPDLIGTQAREDTIFTVVNKTLDVDGTVAFVEKNIMAGSLMVFNNDTLTTGYTFDINAGTITFATAPDAFDVINATYLYVSPYYGWPIAFDSASMSAFLDTGLADDTWYVNTSEVANPIINTYDIFIDSEDRWNASTLATGIPDPEDQGTVQQMTVSGLNPGANYSFAIRAFDEANLMSPLSNSPNATAMKDDVAPRMINDLVANPGADHQTVQLTFTAVGDDMMSGTADHYIVKYSDKSITNWVCYEFIADEFTGSLDAPIAASGVQNLVLEGLTPGDNLFFAIQAVDEAGNVGMVSNTDSAVVTNDTTAPGDIMDLAAAPGSSSKDVYLTWTAPGDDGAVGQADSYIVKYSTAPINASNFDAATDFAQSWTPAAPGVTEHYNLSMPLAGVTYHFAIKAVDEAGNIAANFNSVNAISLAADVTAPGGITDLAVETGLDHGYTFLNFTAPGDDGLVGTATNYLVHWTKNGLIDTEANWTAGDATENSTVWGISFTPQPAGSPESLSMPPKWNILADIGSQHYWAVRAIDEEGNMGPISTGAPLMAFPKNDVTSPNVIGDLAASPSSQDSKISLSWTAPGDDANVGVVQQYIVGISGVTITDANWGTLPPANKSTITIGATPGFENPGDHGPGTVETWDWPNPLTKGNTYFFAIKALDENTANIPLVSNSPSSLPSDDVTPPGQITLTAATANQQGEVDLQWTAPADDGHTGASGRATKYEVKYMEVVYETRYIESDRTVIGVLNKTAVETTTYNITGIVSASGDYRVGYHPDENLAKYVNGNLSLGTIEYSKVLLVDSQTPHIYDTVYVDLNCDQDFSDEKACFMGDETAYRDEDGDGLADISGGMVYFISQAKTLPSPETLTLYLDGEDYKANLTHKNVMNRSEEITWQGARVKAPANVDDKNATLLHTNVSALVVYEDDSVVSGTHYTADLAAGTIMFDAAPEGNITASYTFNTNIMKYTLELEEGKITFDDAVDPADVIIIDYQYDGLPIPYSERYAEKYGIDNVIPKNGELVAFFGEFTLDASYGTSYASAIAGQAKMEYETTAGGFKPGLGLAPNATVVAISDPLFDGMMFATEGYDGIPGTGDEAQITSTALAQSSTYETGFDLYSKFADWLITEHSGDRTAITATSGGSGPGFGTVTSPGSAPAVITAGLATNFFYRTVDGIYDGGPNPSSGDIISSSGRGPTMLGAPKPDVVAAGAYFSFASNPLYYNFDSDEDTHVTDLWLYGHTLTAPTAAAGLALVYDAYYHTGHTVIGEVVAEATNNITTAQLDHKMITAGYQIWKDGSILTEGKNNDYVLDTTNGVIYFTEPVTEGETITATYDYEMDMPLSSEAKKILMSGADDINYDTLTQGAGYMNTLESANIASETSGTTVMPSSWTPGDYEGVKYDAFPSIVTSDTDAASLAQEFTVENHDTAGNITANISAEVLRKTGESVIARNPGTADGMLGPISTILNESGFFDIDGNQLAAIDPSDFNDCELLKITVYTENNTDYWLEIFDWTDTNGNGRLDQDKAQGAGDNYQGALGFGERNRWTGSFVYVNMHEAKIYNPAERSHDGIYIWNRATAAASADTVWYIKAEFYQKTDWDWMGLSAKTVDIAPGATGTFTATLDKAEAVAAGVGTYQGGIYCEVMGKTVTIPITVNVGAENPKFEFGGDNVIEVHNETVVQSYADEYNTIKVYDEITVESTSEGATFFTLQNDDVVNDTYITFTNELYPVALGEMVVGNAADGQTQFTLSNGSLADPTDIALMYRGMGLNLTIVNESAVERGVTGQTEFFVSMTDLVNTDATMELFYQGALSGGLFTSLGSPTGPWYNVDEATGKVTLGAAMTDDDKVWATYQYAVDTTEVSAVTDETVVGPTAGGETGPFNLMNTDIIDISLYQDNAGTQSLLTEGTDYALDYNSGQIDMMTTIATNEVVYGPAAGNGTENGPWSLSNGNIVDATIYHGEAGDWMQMVEGDMYNLNDTTGELTMVPGEVITVAGEYVGQGDNVQQLFWLDNQNIVDCTLYTNDSGLWEIWYEGSSDDYLLNRTTGLIDFAPYGGGLDAPLDLYAYYNYSISTATVAGEYVGQGDDVQQIFWLDNDNIVDCTLYTNDSGLWEIWYEGSMDDYLLNRTTGMIDFAPYGGGLDAPLDLYAYYNYSIPLIPLATNKNIVAYYNYSQMNAPMAFNQTLTAFYNYTDMPWIPLDQKIYVDTANATGYAELIDDGIVNLNDTWMMNGMYPGSQMKASYTYAITEYLDPVFYDVDTASGTVNINTTLMPTGLAAGVQINTWYTYQTLVDSYKLNQSNLHDMSYTVYKNRGTFTEREYWFVDTADEYEGYLLKNPEGPIIDNTIYMNDPVNGTITMLAENTDYTIDSATGEIDFTLAPIPDERYLSIFYNYTTRNNGAISEYGVVVGEVAMNNSNIVNNEFLINATGGETTVNLASGNIGPNTYAISLNGTEMVEGIDYTINLTTGQITFELPLWPEANITANYSSFDPNVHSVFLENGELFSGFRDINNPRGYVIRLNGATVGPTTFTVDEATGEIAFTNPTRNFAAGDYLTVDYYYGSYTTDTALGEVTFLSSLSEYKIAYVDYEHVYGPAVGDGTEYYFNLAQQNVSDVKLYFRNPNGQWMALSSESYTVNEKSGSVYLDNGMVINETLGTGDGSTVEFQLNHTDIINATFYIQSGTNWNKLTEGVNYTLDATLGIFDSSIWRPLESTETLYSFYNYTGKIYGREVYNETLGEGDGVIYEYATSNQNLTLLEVYLRDGGTWTMLVENDGYIVNMTSGVIDTLDAHIIVHETVVVGNGVDEAFPLDNGIIINATFFIKNGTTWTKLTEGVNYALNYTSGEFNSSIWRPLDGNETLYAYYNYSTLVNWTIYNAGQFLHAYYTYSEAVAPLTVGQHLYAYYSWMDYSRADNVIVDYNYSDVDEILNPRTANLGFDGNGGKAGDWRFFYVTIPDAGVFADDLTKLMLKAEWNRQNTDIDLLAFGATSLNSYSATGVDTWDSDRYGPYGMTNNGGSTETSTFFTASGGPLEYSMPSIGAGLNIIALHTVLMNGTGNWETFKGEVGTFSLSTDKVDIVTNELSGSTTITSVSNIDLGGPMGGVAAGPSAPEHYEDLIVWQDEDDWTLFDTFEEQLASGNTSIYVHVENSLIFDVHIYGHMASYTREGSYGDVVDMDLGIFLDANGDGVTQPEEFVAMDADWDADEHVKLIAPADGDYIIRPFGFTMSNGVMGHYDIDITNVQGLGFGVEGEGTDLTPDETNMWKTSETLDAYTPSGIDLSWDLASAKNGITLQGALYVGPGDGAFAMLLPIELRYDDIAPVIDGMTPANGAATKNNMPLLTAGFKDEDGSSRAEGELNGNTASLFLDGVEITDQSSISVPLIDDSESAVQGYPTGTVSWEAPGPLDDGAHVAEARIQDAAGNELVHQWSFIVDTGIPHIELNLPEGDYYTADANLKVEGMTELNADFRIIGTQVNSIEIDDTGNFMANLELTAGVNDVEIYATDAAGNTAVLEKSIVLDTVVPEFEVFRSTAGTMTNKQSTTLKGKLSERGTLTINSKNIAVNSDGTFSAEFALNEGANDFEFVFHDYAGNEASETLTVTKDTTAPQITLTSAPTEVTGESYNFTGTTEDGVILSVNGKQVTLTPGTKASTFSRTVLLNYGPNTIVIEAKDGAGNVMEMRHVVNRVEDGGTGPNWAAIGLMIVLLVVGLMVGLLVAMMIWKEDEEGEQPLPIETEGEASPDAAAIEGDTEELAPDAGTEEISDENEIAEDVEAGEEAPEVDPETQEKIDKLKQAFEDGKITEELYEKNLATLMGATAVAASATEEPAPVEDVPAEGLAEESEVIEAVEETEEIPPEEPTAEELSEELLADVEEAPDEPETPIDEPTEEVIEDERILKLKQAFEEGKISQELYDKNLARLKKQQ